MIQALKKRLILLYLNQFSIPRDVSRFAFKKYFSRNAFITSSNTITYGGLQERVAAMQSLFKKEQIRKGDLVFIMVKDAVQLIALNITAYETGAIISTFSTQQEHTEVLYIAGVIRPAFFIHDQHADEALLSGLQQALPGIRNILITPGIDEELTRQYPVTAPVSISPDDILSIGFTSGTSGTPKMIAFEHGMFLRSMKLIVKDIRITAQKGTDISIMGFPLDRRGGYVGLIPSLLKGSTIILPEKYDAGLFLALIEQYKATEIHLSPSLLIDLLDHPDRSRYNISSLQKIFYGAEIMAVAKLEEAIRVFGPILQQGYASSEVFPPVSMLESHQLMKHGEINREILSSVGKVSKSVLLKIADDKGEALEAGKTGEILIKSPNAFKGYWNDAAATQAAFAGEYVRTGDIGRITPDGWLFVIGRKSDLLEKAGQTVYPRITEEVAHFHPAIKECVLVSVNEQLLLAVSLRQHHLHADPTKLKTELITLLKEKLDDHQMPDDIIILDELPRNNRSKILRREVRNILG